MTSRITIRVSPSCFSYQYVRRLGVMFIRTHIIHTPRPDLTFRVEFLQTLEPLDTTQESVQPYPFKVHVSTASNN
jgi:hypothetical protein